VYVCLTHVILYTAGPINVWPLIRLQALNGIGLGSAVSIGASTVTDVFFQHERGKAMGVWTLLTNTGAFWACFLGGYIVTSKGWPWVYKTSAIINGATLFAMIVFLPETLYSRRNLDQHDPRLTSAKKFDFVDRYIKVYRRHGKLDLMSALRPIRMAMYPNVFIPAFFMGLGNALGPVAFTVIIPTYFREVYGFSLRASSNVNFALIIGAMAGEVFAGAWSDYLLTRRARSHGGKRIPELRIAALWPTAVMFPVSSCRPLSSFFTIANVYM
jgi:hypothetical protein